MLLLFVSRIIDLKGDKEGQEFALLFMTEFNFLLNSGNFIYTTLQYKVPSLIELINNSPTFYGIDQLFGTLQYQEVCSCILSTLLDIT